MSKIRIKNFGPIKEGVKDDGWIDIKKVTLFIGNQGTGKSTIAKLISTFTWIEKALTRGDISNERLSSKALLRHFDFQNLTAFIADFQDINFNDEHSYSTSSLKNLEVEYAGDSYEISLKGMKVAIRKVENSSYELPQIIYISSERSFLSYVNEASKARTISQPLIELAYEFKQALLAAREPIMLPIDQVEIKYQKDNELAYLKGKDYRIPLQVASSGFQSLAPLYVVSRHLANSVKKAAENDEPMNSDELTRFRDDIARIEFNEDLTNEQKRIAISVLAKKYNKSAFINIIEEPEQNLFPTAQWDILKSLLEFNNYSKGNKLIMTTHSPYIISFLTLAVKAFMVAEKISKSKNAVELNSQLDEIVAKQSRVVPNDLVIYELDDFGRIIKLEDYRGLPSDENYLNDKLDLGNQLFSKMTKIEHSCL